MPSILLFQSRELHHKASGGNSTRDAIERQFPAGVLPGSFSHMPGDWHRKGNLIYVSFDWKSLLDTPADTLGSATKLFEASR